MSLQVVELMNEMGNTLQLPLRDLSHGYHIKDVEGLDPVDAELVSSSFGTVDGAQFQAARRDTRNIVLKLGFDPDYTITSVRSLRLALYSFLMPKSKVIIKCYMDDGLAVTISGYVESFKAPPFTKDPEATISIVCHKPDFHKTTSDIVNGSTVATSAEQVINYAGNIATGFVFKLNVNRTISEVTLYHRGSDNSLNTMEFVGALVAGDVLTISTVSGDKYARLTRAGSTSSILFGIPPSSPWLNLLPGVNNFRAYTAGAAIPFTIEYVAKYGGL